MIQRHEGQELQKETCVLGKMSAKIFLYRLIGCLDLVRREGQKKQRLSQAGISFLDTTPINNIENVVPLQEIPQILHCVSRRKEKGKIQTFFPISLKH